MALEVLALVVAFVLIFRLRTRVGLLERQIEVLIGRVDKPADAALEPQMALRDVFDVDSSPPIVVPTRSAAAADKRALAPEVRPEPQPAPEPAVSFSAASEIPEPVASEAFVPQSERPGARPGISFNVEDLFGRRLPIWAGGITLAIAGVLIVRYAIDLGLLRIFTPAVRVICGLIFGAGLIGGAEAARRHADRVDDPRVAQALCGAGIATLYAAILVAANVYHLVGAGFAFAGLAAVTAAALGLSLRFGAPSAVLGLVGGLAAPALVGVTQPNVPLLSVYLALTVAGLAGVSRMQRWAWLGVLALFGGAGWSLSTMLLGGALDAVSTLSVGMLVLMLALAVPLLVFEGQRAATLRAISAMLGAAQLALLVALGGFAMLNWGLFVLLVAAGQWFAWRDRDFASVPTITLALSVLLLALWPVPPLAAFTLVGLALAAIHVGPLLWRMWQSPASVQRAVELAALAVATLVVPMIHFYAPPREAALSLLALSASLIPIVGLATGWRREDRLGDARFAWLTSAALVLIGSAAVLALAPWAWPVAGAAIAVGALVFGHASHDRRIEPIACVVIAAALVALALDALVLSEAWHLIAGAKGVAGARTLARWSALTLAFAIFAWRGRQAGTRALASILAAALSYGTIAQLTPLALLPLVPPLGLAALAAARGRLAPNTLLPASATLLAILLGWALVPWGIWLNAAVGALVGIPMVLDTRMLSVDTVLRQLLLPALIGGGALWAARERFAAPTVRLATAILAMLALVAVHILYRLAFARAFDANFVATGVSQRLVWEVLLIGGGALLFRSGRWRGGAVALTAAGTLHALWFGLVVHNPLWTAQAVGSLPLLNLLVPLIAAPAAGVVLLRRMLPALAMRAARAMQFLTMAAIMLLCWSLLRQAFHGSILVVAGVSPVEDILRSVLAIALATGFLLWGIRAGRRDWRLVSLALMLGAVGKVFLLDASGLTGLLRIGSFVVLGFSLIGIGWLYSRQLRRDEADREAA